MTKKILTPQEIVEQQAQCFPMTHERRELFMRILNDEQDIHPITLRLCYLAEHFVPHRLDTALKWLIRNNFTGKRFIAWFDHICSGSDLEMVRTLNAIIDNAKLAPVIAGKNFKL